MVDDSHYETLLSRQLLMNQQTWAALQSHGVTEQTELRLDFSYDAPNREAAEILAKTARMSDTISLSRSFDKLKLVGHQTASRYVGNGCRLGISVRILSSRPASLQIFPKP
jgi:hypothetical protein